MYKRLALLAVLAIGISGCGSTAAETATQVATTLAAPSSATPGAWTGLGAKLADWTASHPKNPSNCEETPCYGGQMPDGGGLTDQFSGVETTETPEYRVDGYTQAIGDGTPLSVAESDVLKLLPADTIVTGFWVTHEGGSCASWNLRSRTLARWFARTKKVGDTQGALGVDFFAYNSSDEPMFKPSDVSNAIVSIAPEKRGNSC